MTRAEEAEAELSASRAEVVGLREALDPRAIGEAIVAASSAATETIAIDSEVLVFADATVVIDLVKLAAALAGEKPVGAGER